MGARSGWWAASTPRRQGSGDGRRGRGRDPGSVGWPIWEAASADRGVLGGAGRFAGPETGPAANGRRDATVVYSKARWRGSPASGRLSGAAVVRARDHGAMARRRLQARVGAPLAGVGSPVRGRQLGRSAHVKMAGMIRRGWGGPAGPPHAERTVSPALAHPPNRQARTACGPCGRPDICPPDGRPRGDDGEKGGET